MRPFYAAFNAFRATGPSFSAEAGRYLQPWLNTQLKMIEEDTSFSLRELKNYEKLNVGERPENLSHEKALESVVANQEIVVHKKRKLLLRSHIPGTGAIWTFAVTESWMYTIFDSLQDTIFYTSVPVFVMSMIGQNLVREWAYTDQYKKLKMAAKLKELCEQAKSKNLNNHEDNPRISSLMQ